MQNNIFFVWWEPEYDQKIDKDSVNYANILGEGIYLATAPSIRAWDDFKETILKLERGELKGKPETTSSGMEGLMKGFLKDLKKKKKTK